jgi:hypothetical protein
MPAATPSPARPPSSWPWAPKDRAQSIDEYLQNK